MPLCNWPPLTSWQRWIISSRIWLLLRLSLIRETARDRGLVPSCVRFFFFSSLFLLLLLLLCSATAAALGGDGEIWRSWKRANGFVSLGATSARLCVYFLGEFREKTKSCFFVFITVQVGAAHASTAGLFPWQTRVVGVGGLLVLSLTEEMLIGWNDVHRFPLVAARWTLSFAFV